MKKCKKFIAFVCIFAMLFSMVGYADATSAKGNDITEHWAAKDLTEWLAKGYITADAAGLVNPNSVITRAEFANYVNKAFKLTEKATVSFTDVKSTDTFADDVAKAVKAGYMVGNSDGTWKPNATITRQEVAVLLARLIGLDDTSNGLAFAGFGDKAKVSTWATNSVIAVSANGYMAGDGKNFNPLSNMTRAEAVALLTRANGDYYAFIIKTSGIVNTAKLDGNVYVKANNVEMKGTDITGNLVIGKEVGDGNFTLRDSVVKGNIVINGGGVNSIHLINIVTGNVIVQRADGNVRVSLEGTSNISSLSVLTPASLQLAAQSQIAALVLNSPTAITGTGTITSTAINTTGVTSTIALSNVTGSVGSAGVATPSTTTSTIPSVSSGGGSSSSGNSGGSSGGGTNVTKTKLAKPTNAVKTIEELWAKWDKVANSSGYILRLYKRSGDSKNLVETTEVTAQTYEDSMKAYGIALYPIVATKVIESGNYIFTVAAKGAGNYLNSDEVIIGETIEIAVAKDAASLDIALSAEETATVLVVSNTIDYMDNGKYKNFIKPNRIKLIVGHGDVNNMKPSVYIYAQNFTTENNKDFSWAAVGFIAHVNTAQELNNALRGFESEIIAKVPGKNSYASLYSPEFEPSDASPYYGFIDDEGKITVDVDNQYGLLIATGYESDIDTIRLAAEIEVAKGMMVAVNQGQTLVLKNTLTVEGTMEVSGNIITPASIMAISASSPKLAIVDNGKISIKDGASIEFSSFTDIITPTQDSVLLYAGAKVKVGAEQYIGDSSMEALIELSNFEGSNVPVAGYFLNGDGKLLLVIFEKAKVLQNSADVLDIAVLIKAGDEYTSAGELKIPDLSIIKTSMSDDVDGGSITIEANGRLIQNGRALVSADEASSVFNATGGELDNRHGISFFKNEDNSIWATIKGDVIMNSAYNTAIIKPEYRPYNEHYGKDLKPTLDIRFDPTEGDFIGAYWNNITPVKGKYQMNMDNKKWVKAGPIDPYIKGVAIIDGSNFEIFTTSGLTAGTTTAAVYSLDNDGNLDEFIVGGIAESTTKISFSITNNALLSGVDYKVIIDDISSSYIFEGVVLEGITYTNDEKITYDGILLGDKIYVNGVLKCTINVVVDDYFSLPKEAAQETEITYTVIVFRNNRPLYYTKYSVEAELAP